MTSESYLYGQGDGSYQAAGQLDGITQLVERFYFYMETLPQARGILAMHDSDLTESKKKLAYFLSGWLGGPRLYAENYGSIRIPMAHRHLNITEVERDAWLLCMKKALDEQPYPEAFKDYLLDQLFVPAERIRVACESHQDK